MLHFARVGAGFAGWRGRSAPGAAHVAPKPPAGRGALCSYVVAYSDHPAPNARRPVPLRRDLVVLATRPLPSKTGRAPTKAANATRHTPAAQPARSRIRTLRLPAVPAEAACEPLPFRLQRRLQAARLRPPRAQILRERRRRAAGSKRAPRKSTSRRRPGFAPTAGPRTIERSERSPGSMPGRSCFRAVLAKSRS